MTSSARYSGRALDALPAGPGGDHNAPRERAAEGSSDDLPDSRVVDVDFEAVFLAEYGKLVRYLCTQGADQHEADDAVQAAFEQALAQWHAITAPRPWLYRVAMRMFLNGDVRLRRRETPTDDLHTLDTTDDDPVAYTVREYMVMEAIRALPYLQRTVMGLTITEFTPSEIAEFLGSTSDSVRQNLRRARITLTDQMKHAWKETP